MNERAGQIFQWFSSMTIACTNRDLRHTIQHIQLGNSQGGAAVEFADVARDDCIKPANAARATRGRAKFTAQIAQGVTVRALEFAGHWCCAYLRAISFGYATNPANL